MTNRDMYRAAVISQRVQNDFVTGLQVAKLHELKARMRREVVKFAYLKKDKSVRIAYGTLMSALVGDRILKGTTFSKYKQFIENCFALMPRHALHARSLGFVHPRTGKEVYFESELPPDFKAVVEKWEGYTTARPYIESDEE